MLLASLAALGCGPEFEEQSTLTSLRVLGVRKDKPYAQPGDTVKLSMLYDDAAGLAADAAPKKRDVLITWISGCENPNGDSYLGCVPELAKTAAAITKAEPGTDPCIIDGRRVCGIGPEYSFQLSDKIVSGHPPPPDKSTRYGLEYVFFIVCAGTLGPAPSGQQFPIACYSKSGKQLGADDFVVGYTAVYAYNASDLINNPNTNPKVTGFSMGPHNVPVLCLDEACIREELPSSGLVPDAGAGDASGDAGSDAAVEGGAPPAEGGIPGGPDADPCADPDAATCLEVCTEEKQKDCPEHDIKLETDPHTLEPDGAAGKGVLEQAWINYYTEQGEFVNDVKLLGDATEGYQENHGTKLRAPKKLGPFKVWGVAHDNRGGVGWAEVRLATRKAK